MRDPEMSDGGTPWAVRHINSLWRLQSSILSVSGAFSRQRGDRVDVNVPNVFVNRISGHFCQKTPKFFVKSI
jgi:hypothetical protein